jgi:general secretion pathway protein G
MRAGMSGDETAVFDNTYLVNEEASAEAHALMGVSIAEEKWRAALAAAFKLPGLSSVSQDIEEAAKAIAAATVTVNGDTAEVVMNPGTTIGMMRDKGVWKVDFYKTQRGIEGPFNKDAVAAAAARAKIYNDMTAELKAGKYASEAAASSELDARLAKAPDLSPRAVQANRGMTISDIKNIKTALAVFEVDVGRFPTTAEGLAALLKCPKGLGATWQGPYLEKMPTDRWGHDYVYVMPGTDDPTAYDLISAGPDGELGTADDIKKNTEK